MPNMREALGQSPAPEKKNPRIPVGQQVGPQNIDNIYFQNFLICSSNVCERIISD
jgi:hypothetical protein